MTTPHSITHGIYNSYTHGMQKSKTPRYGLTKGSAGDATHLAAAASQVLAVVHVPRRAHSAVHVSTEDVGLFRAYLRHGEVAPSTILHLPHAAITSTHTQTGKSKEGGGK